MPLNIEGNNPNDVTLKALLMLLEVTMKIVQMLIGSMINKGGPATSTSAPLRGAFNPIPKQTWNAAPAPAPAPAASEDNSKDS